MINRYNVDDCAGREEINNKDGNWVKYDDIKHFLPDNIDCNKCHHHNSSNCCTLGALIGMLRCVFSPKIADNTCNK